MRPGHLEICVIGAGPRGLSIVERLCANERAAATHETITVHIVDPSAPGSGAVWRAEQSRYLLTNTVAAQITVYTDDSARIEGPVEPGPSLYEWAKSLALLGELGEYEAETLAEARSLGPDSYPTRAFYGRYLNDSFQQIVARAPEHVTIAVHRSRAVAMADTNGIAGGPQGVRLEDGTRLHELDAVVLAQGHLPARLSAREERTASLARIHLLTYVPPANPADLELSAIEAGRPVLLRGLGLNFFDHMALFTVGRGGSFVREGDRLRYRPSGREPVLYASSRRGVPYHARGENQKGAFGRYRPRLLTPEVIARLRERAGVRFGADVWPLIALEVESVYYGALLRSRGEDPEPFVRRYLSASGDRDEDLLLDTYRIAPAERWDWDRIAHPCQGLEFADRAEFRAWLLDYLARDVREAKAGNVDGPLKAALDVLRDLRNEIRLVVDHGGLAGDSHQDELDAWYTPLNAFLSIGPPVSRIEEMIALIEAGILEITGPGTQICIDTEDPAFVAQSGIVPGPPIRAEVLIEARLPEPDLRRTADPLMRHLLATEQCRTYRIPGAAGETYETGGLAVTERPYRLVDTQDRAHPRRFAYGVPTEAVHWVTAAGIRPGVDSVTLGDSDAIARTILDMPTATPIRRPAVEGTRLMGVIV
ncbi:FAD/NAD(P)-binding protein [Sciscionella sediminilitoris]|uniref:FAD/NAD(P)-binding protein n=1 Tax=Sciscionella sediminilitoris TaxID=1445613 RepID=UPI0004DFCAAE|nr:FAD/NAD(P)-binding protein [Sciscionella sp. SE31]